MSCLLVAGEYGCANSLLTKIGLLASQTVYGSVYSFQRVAGKRVIVRSDSVLFSAVHIPWAPVARRRISMSFDTAAGAATPAPFPIQYVSIELMPVVGGKLSVAMQATLLDEERLEFVGEDLAHAQVDTIDQALAVIRQNVAALVPA
jgi:hypothetical protein